MGHLVVMSVCGGGGRLYLEVEVPVPDGLEDGETFLPGPAYQQLGLRLLNIAANYRYSWGHCLLNIAANYRYRWGHCLLNIAANYRDSWGHCLLNIAANYRYS